MGGEKAKSADDWIQEALYEYEQIANLCNQQSHLGQAALSYIPTSSLPYSPDDGGIHQSIKSIGFDPKALESAIKYNQLVGHLSTYSEQLETVRNSHVRLKSKLKSFSKTQDATTNEQHLTNQNNPRPIIPRRSTSAMEEAFINHVDLSERVTRTIMKSYRTECGVLFENGMIRPSSANDHEVNIVALAALRASISQLQAKFGGSDKG